MKLLLGILIIRPIMGFIAMAIASDRDMDGGFFWGFFLGIIGIIVVAVRPNDNKKTSSFDNSLDYSSHIFFCNKCNTVYSGYYLATKEHYCNKCNVPVLETTILRDDWRQFSTEEKKRMISALSSGQYLRFPSLSNTNPTIIEKKPKEIDERKEYNTDKEQMPYSEADEIKKFKELADSGIITQEEFEAKKKQLLGL